MTRTVDWDLVQEAQKRAVIEIMDTVQALTDLNVGPRGETFGTEHMEIGDRILAFIDDVQSGALQMLTAINEDFAMRYVREFLQDVGSSPDYQRNAALQGIASQAQQIVEGGI